MSILPTIQQATSSDTTEIANFLDHASFVHRHLDWTPLLDWIGTSPFLIYYLHQHLKGVLVCPPDPPGIAWIKCYACDRPADSTEIFASLLEVAKNKLPHSIENLFALGLNDWFRLILQKCNFEKFQDVIVLKYEHWINEKLKNSPDVIRPMELIDILEVARIDQTSFEPIWTISEEGLKSAFFQADHASVAEINGNIVGYELSTASHFSAHLARVAVLPEYQKENIGFHLVSEMISSFLKRGINDITVNTQDTNRASLNLYKRVGFEPTGESFPIFRKSVSSITGQ